MPWALSNAASFAAAVVFPAPCSPANTTTVGPPPAGAASVTSPPPAPPRASVSWSLTTLISWSRGVTPGVTATPAAPASTAFRNAVTAAKLTSASSSVRRSSRRGARMLRGDRSSASCSVAQACSKPRVMPSKAEPTAEQLKRRARHVRRGRLEVSRWVAATLRGGSAAVHSGRRCLAARLLPPHSATAGAAAVPAGPGMLPHVRLHRRAERVAECASAEGDRNGVAMDDIVTLAGANAVSSSI